METSAFFPAYSGHQNITCALQRSPKCEEETRRAGHLQSGWTPAAGWRLWTLRPGTQTASLCVWATALTGQSHGWLHTSGHGTQRDPTPWLHAHYISQETSYVTYRSKALLASHHNVKTVNPTFSATSMPLWGDFTIFTFIKSGMCVFSVLYVVDYHCKKTLHNDNYVFWFNTHCDKQQYSVAEPNKWSGI